LSTYFPLYSCSPSNMTTLLSLWQLLLLDFFFFFLFSFFFAGIGDWTQGLMLAKDFFLIFNMCFVYLPPELSLSEMSYFACDIHPCIICACYRCWHMVGAQSMLD
jgi:hypothetical protein